MRKFLAIALSAMMIFALVACGSTTGTKYVAKSAEMFGLEVSMEDLGTTGETYIILGDNGKAEFAFDGEKETVGYTMVGTTITLNGVSVGEVYGELDGNTLTLVISEDGMDFTIIYQVQ